MPAVKMSFWDTAITIFFVFNSLGMVPVFVSILARYDQKKQMKIIVRELVIALIVLLAFTFFGSRILKSISISQSTVGIGGGLLLIIIALNMLFPKIDPHAETSKKDVPGKEPFIIPLAIPGLAGPGSITAMMIFSSQAGPLVASGAFILAWIPSFIIILAASYIKKFLGDKGILAVEKLGGMLISWIGIETLSKGVIDLVKANF
ncbi:MAG: MarC family protein [Parachlamydiales bacterium]|nr:MarC family protein [Parachlamydiales bacterium]